MVGNWTENKRKYISKRKSIYKSNVSQRYAFELFITKKWHVIKQKKNDEKDIQKNNNKETKVREFCEF